MENPVSQVLQNYIVVTLYNNVFITGDDVPTMGELYTSVIHQYAAQWEQLGLKLGLQHYDIANISKDNAHNPDQSVTCCRTVLEKWLQTFPSPTWGKLVEVIILLTNAPVQCTGYKGIVYLVLKTLTHDVTTLENDHLKRYYNATRFTTEEECWPPEQPKHFTPVVLIRQEGRRSKKETQVMASATSKGNIEEYISTTTSKMTKDLQEICSQLEQSSDNQYQHSILIEGSPGVGKSILLKHIAYLWASGELLTNIRFLFLLHLRDHSVQQMHSLQSLVHYFYHYDKQAEKVTSCVAQDGGKAVTILLDGYDELPPNIRQKSFIFDLLQHKILPACSILVSSRPHASTHLRDNIRCQVEILGFSEQDQQHFIEHSLRGQPHKILELKQYLKYHPTISNLCFIPFNMTILLFLYKNKEETLLPTNSTGLYNLFICLTICRHLAKCGIILDKEIKDFNSLPQPYSKIINQLSKFAFKALGNNQLVFTLAEIKEVCLDIDKSINGFGLLHAVEYAGITSKSVSMNFIHFSIQEFLAVHHVTTLSPSEELSFLQKNFWNNPIYFNMFDIYVALTNGQRPSFKRFLQQPSFMERFRKFFTGKEESIGISQQFLNDNLKCLRMYYCFQEAGDEVMYKSIEKATQLDKQQIDLSRTRLSPSDLEYLTTFLTCSSHKEWKMLDLFYCQIQDHGLQILQRGLRNSNIIITVLVLALNGLTTVSSSTITELTIGCRVKILNIDSNNTVGENDELYRILTDDSSMVEQLHLRFTQLSSSTTIKLFTSLSKAKKLRKLWIDDNNITDEACDAIIMAMKKNNSLVELSMYNNPVGAEKAQMIVQALQHNNTLILLYLSDDYPDDVKGKIRSIQEIIRENRNTCGCQINLQIVFCS